MKKQSIFQAAALISIFACSPAFAVVKSIALDHLDSLDSIIAKDEKTLSAMRLPDANTTLLIRDQNKRYMDLQNRISSTFGEQPQIGSGEFNCTRTFENAQFVWQAKVGLAKSPSNFNRDALDNYKRLYKETRAACNEFLKKQK